MNSVVIRKSLTGLQSYFKSDFGSRMWIDESGERLVEPSIGALLPGKAAVVSWQPMKPEVFSAVIKRCPATIINSLGDN